MGYLVLCGYNHPTLIAEFVRIDDARMFCEAYLKQSAYANMFIVDSDKCRFIPKAEPAEATAKDMLNADALTDPFADEIEHIR